MASGGSAPPDDDKEKEKRQWSHKQRREVDSDKWTRILSNRMAKSMVRLSKLELPPGCLPVNLMEMFGTEDEIEIAAIQFRNLNLIASQNTCDWEGCCVPNQPEPEDKEKKLVFASVKLLVEHILSDHYTADYICRWPKCPLNGEKLSTKTSWMDHICVCLGYDPYVCGICKRSFASEKHYRGHTDKHSEEEKNEYWASRKAAEPPYQPQPPVIRQSNTNSVFRFRKITWVYEKSHQKCLHFKCLKLTHMSKNPDYCDLHAGYRYIIWDTEPPSPLYLFQDPTITTNGDFYWRREKFSEFDGQWKKVCARDDCFMPLNQQQPPFCSQKCKEEYEWKLKIQEEGAAAIALLPNQPVRILEIVNLPPNFYGPRLERLNDPLVENNMKHVKFRMAKSGWAPLCEVRDCNILKKSCKGNQHKESNVKVPNSHLLIFKNDQDEVHSEPVNGEWPKGAEFWTRRRWHIEESKWEKLCWNWECNEIIHIEGFCLSCKDTAVPDIITNESALKRARSTSSETSGSRGRGRKSST